MAHKETERVVRLLRQQAWRVVDGGKHYKCYPPDPTKPMVTMAKTPSDRRALPNAIARLRRSGADL